MFANLTGSLEQFPESPIDAWILFVVGWYMCFLMSAVVSVNGMLLVTFFGSRDLRQPINTFVICVTFLNFFGALIEFPFVIASNFAGKWVFGHLGCAMSGYSAYFVGSSSIYLMMAISFERFYTIYDPMSMRKITFKNSLVGVQICLLLGAFWPTMPLLGWSHYALEGGMTSCSVTWNEQSTNVISYNASIFLFVYCVPIVTIVTTNTKMLLILKNLPKVGNAEDPKQQKRINMERRVTYVMMGYILLFVVTWTPYAIAALWSAFIDPGHVSPYFATLPAFVAKSSMLWSPLFFIFSNKKIKKRMTARQETSISGESASQSNVMSKVKDSTASQT